MSSIYFTCCACVLKMLYRQSLLLLLFFTGKGQSHLTITQKVTTTLTLCYMYSITRQHYLYASILKDMLLSYVLPPPSKSNKQAK